MAKNKKLIITDAFKLIDNQIKEFLDNSEEECLKNYGVSKIYQLRLVQKFIEACVYESKHNWEDWNK